MRAIFHKCLNLTVGPLGVLATVLVTATVTAGATSYVNLVQLNRTAVEEDFTKLKGTSVEFFQILDTYSTRARTGAAVDPETQRRFHLTLLKLYSEAENIAKRQPKAKPEFDRYTKALFDLESTAKALHGPLDGKPFVEAVSEYFDAEGDLKARVSTLQGRVLSYLF